MLRRAAQAHLEIGRGDRKRECINQCGISENTKRGCFRQIPNLKTRANMANCLTLSDAGRTREISKPNNPQKFNVEKLSHPN